MLSIEEQTETALGGRSLFWDHLTCTSKYGILAVGEEICLAISPQYGLGTRRMLIIQFLVTPQRGERH